MDSCGWPRVDGRVVENGRQTHERRPLVGRRFVAAFTTRRARLADALRGGAATRWIDHCTSPPFVRAHINGTRDRAQYPGSSAGHDSCPVVEGDGGRRRVGTRGARRRWCLVRGEDLDRALELWVGARRATGLSH